MQGQLGLKRTWLLLRHLLDPTSSKHEQQHRLNTFLHQWPGTEDELLQELQSRYVGVPRTTSLPPYAGSSNPLLDSDITVPEVRAALLQLHTNSTPGPDQITNKALRNLDDPNLAAINPGPRMYGYIKAFLTDRQATITLGSLTSDPIQLGSYGTPQGSVLSPFLFNLALLPLPAKLNTLPGLHYSLYADDITLWMGGGSDGHIEATLQSAVDIIAVHVGAANLSCSPQKSELLLLRPSRVATTPPEIRLQVNNHLIPEVPTIRVLGLLIQNNGKNTQALQKLQISVDQTLRLIHRISSRHHGLKEQEMLRLVQAFVISRLVFSTPYLPLQRAELDKVNALIRKTYKAALSLSPSTSTDRLLKLGVHNTAEELAEAHLTAQYERLSTTQAGRHILTSLQINFPSNPSHKCSLPLDIRQSLQVSPIPRNMHPQYHEQRRLKRAEALHKRLGGREDVAYVDAAEYTRREAFALSAVNDAGSLLTSATLYTTLSEEAEEFAIALAMTNTSATTIIALSPDLDETDDWPRSALASQQLSSSFGVEDVRVKSDGLCDLLFTLDDLLRFLSGCLSLDPASSGLDSSVSPAALLLVLMM
ncbi:uncharacterized protein LOC121835420 [Ixodes scapularis]|uniref:uncharacterized protein LOC121835420 n=1 Tax=Ixodes scapularis TaxID=6945 RepID=UPI001A9DB1DB|nr:uncharacterized protein LOC121835420 [Ixodes scapularis]